MIHQAKPSTVSDLFPVYIEQFMKIMAEPQTDPDLACCLIPLENKGGEQPGRAVLDR
jgi:hypothetical protein